MSYLPARPLWQPPRISLPLPGLLLPGLQAARSCLACCFLPGHPRSLCCRQPHANQHLRACAQSNGDWRAACEWLV